MTRSRLRLASRAPVSRHHLQCWHEWGQESSSSYPDCGRTTGPVLSHARVHTIHSTPTGLLCSCNKVGYSNSTYIYSFSTDINDEVTYLYIINLIYATVTFPRQDLHSYIWHEELACLAYKAWSVNIRYIIEEMFVSSASAPAAPLSRPGPRPVCARVPAPRLNSSSPSSSQPGASPGTCAAPPRTPTFCQISKESGLPPAAAPLTLFS